MNGSDGSREAALFKPAQLEKITHLICAATDSIQALNNHKAAIFQSRK